MTIAQSLQGYKNVSRSLWRVWQTCSVHPRICHENGKYLPHVYLPKWGLLACASASPSSLRCCWRMPFMLVMRCCSHAFQKGVFPCCWFGIKLQLLALSHKTLHPIIIPLNLKIHTAIIPTGSYVLIENLTALPAVNSITPQEQWHPFENYSSPVSRDSRTKSRTLKSTMQTGFRTQIPEQLLGFVCIIAQAFGQPFAHQKEFLCISSLIKSSKALLSDDSPTHLASPLWYHLLLLSLHPIYLAKATSRFSLHRPDLLLFQRLYSCLLCLECFSPNYPHGSLSHLLFKSYCLLRPPPNIPAKTVTLAPSILYGPHPYLSPLST